MRCPRLSCNGVAAVRHPTIFESIETIGLTVYGVTRVWLVAWCGEDHRVKAWELVQRWEKRFGELVRRSRSVRRRLTRDAFKMERILAD